MTSKKTEFRNFVIINRYKEPNPDRYIATSKDDNELVYEGATLEDVRDQIDNYWIEFLENEIHSLRKANMRLCEEIRDRNHKAIEAVILTDEEKEEGTFERKTKKFGKELEFISFIKRDGSGVIMIGSRWEKGSGYPKTDNMSYADDELFSLEMLSLSNKTFIASSLNSFVARLKLDNKQ